MKTKEKTSLYWQIAISAAVLVFLILGFFIIKVSDYKKVEYLGEKTVEYTISFREDSWYNFVNSSLILMVLDKHIVNDSQDKYCNISVGSRVHAYALADSKSYEYKKKSGEIFRLGIVSTYPLSEKELKEITKRPLLQIPMEYFDYDSGGIFWKCIIIFVCCFIPLRIAINRIHDLRFLIQREKDRKEALLNYQRQQK